MAGFNILEPLVPKPLEPKADVGFVVSTGGAVNDPNMLRPLDFSESTGVGGPPRDRPPIPVSAVVGSADIGSSELEVEMAIGEASAVPSALATLNAAGGARVAPNPKAG